MPVLKAVYDDKLVLLLQKLGLLKMIENGELFCCQCRKAVTIDNFGAVKRTNGKLVVFCNSPECVAHSIKENAE